MKKSHFIQRRLQYTLSVLVSGFLLSFSCGADGLQWQAGGHAGDVTGVAYSPDGQVVASSSDDSTVKLWSAAGDLLGTLSVYPRQATSMAFSPDGTKLAIGTYHGLFSEGKGAVEMWESSDGWQSSSNAALVHTTTHHLGQVHTLAFSADGTRFASGGDEGSNVVQQVSNGAVLQGMAVYYHAIVSATYDNRPSPILSLDFSSDGSLACGTRDNTIVVWDASYAQVWSNTTAHASNVTAVAFSPDGSQLASGSLDGTVKTHSTAGWSLIRTFSGHSDGVCSVAFSPDGSVLASGGNDQTARLWNTASGSSLAVLSGHADAVSAIGFAPDGNTVVTGGDDHTVRTWTVPGGAAVDTFNVQNGTMRMIACAPDGRTVAGVTGEQRICLRNVADGSLLHVLDGHSSWVSAIAFSPNGQYLASVGDTLIIWQVDDGSQLYSINADNSGYSAVAFSPDGSLLATGGDATDQVIRLRDPETGSLVRTLAGHADGVTALTFSPTGSLLASAGRRPDNTVKLWDPVAGTLEDTFSGISNNVECIAFSPDEQTVAAAGNGDSVIKAWNVSTGIPQTFGSGSRPVYALMFSPDGGTLASIGDDQIDFWDMTSGLLSHTWSTEAMQASCFAYSPNGNLLAFGRDDAVMVVASNPWSVLGQPVLTFSSIGEMAGDVYLDSDGEAGVRYLIQTSSNLVDWVDLEIVMSPTNGLQVIDPAGGTESHQFYRAVTLP